MGQLIHMVGQFSVFFTLFILTFIVGVLVYTPTNSQGGYFPPTSTLALVVSRFLNVSQLESLWFCFLTRFYLIVFLTFIQALIKINEWMFYHWNGYWDLKAYFIDFLISMCTSRILAFENYFSNLQCVILGLYGNYLNLLISDKQDVWTLKQIDSCKLFWNEIKVVGP